jgi:hypothetical protein
MKKRLVALLAGLLTVLSMGFGLAQFSDVPAGHWAKEAVEALAAKGILVGFPDGTFRGNETLTRYQAALIIYRLLQQIEEELKAKGESPTMEAMSSEDLEALKNAIQELAAELAALGGLRPRRAPPGRSPAGLEATQPPPSGSDWTDSIARPWPPHGRRWRPWPSWRLAGRHEAHAQAIQALTSCCLLNQDVLSLRDQVAP